MSSSVSSFDGNSDRDSLFQKNYVEGIASASSSTVGVPAINAPITSSTMIAPTLRHSYLRKTDLLDTLDTTTNRLRDTDAWSVAATIDDQESVISAHGNPPSIITSSSRMTMDRETDLYNEDVDEDEEAGGEEDRSSVVSSIRNIRITHSHTRHSSHNNNNNNNNNNNSNNNNSNNNSMPQALHSNSSMNHPPSIVGSLPSIIPHIIEDDEDKGSRSNAAEFGDDGTRSAAADFDDHSSVTSDSVHEDSLHHGHPHRHHHQHLHHHHSVVDDQIMAPPQPQPSFAATASVVSTKSYAELLEENDLLQQQLRAMRIQMKHQEEMIYHLRQLTECNDEVYGKALHLSQIKEEDLKKINSLSIGGRSSSRSSSTHSGRAGGDATSGSLLMTANLNSIDYSQIAPIVNARTLTQKLVRLAETVTRFSQSAAINEEWSLRLEQVLYLRIMESYLGSLPFGTENQHLLNTAYSDQIRRFHNTLGANFAKWYRRQTVQSLSLNPATKEYLQHMRSYVTEQMLGIVNTMLQAAAAAAAAAAATAATSPTKEGHDTEEHSLDDNDAKGNKVEEGDDMEDVQQMTTTRATHENTTTATSQPTAAVAPPTAALLDQNNLHLWNELLELCSALSLEIHGGDADVTAQIIAVGSKYDEEIMAPIGDDLKNTNIKDKAVKMVVSPLFVDEDEVVLLPARVVLE